MWFGFLYGSATGRDSATGTMPNSVMSSLLCGSTQKKWMIFRKCLQNGKVTMWNKSITNGLRRGNYNQKKLELERSPELIYYTSMHEIETALYQVCTPALTLGLWVAKWREKCPSQYKPSNDKELEWLENLRYHQTLVPLDLISASTFKNSFLLI